MKSVVVIFDPADPHRTMKVYAPVGGGFIDTETAQTWVQANCGEDNEWVITPLEVAS